jgi:DNA polymerase IV
MAERMILHIDMDAFFAAIEQKDHPEWVGKPVIIGADPQAGRGRGVVSTCSYEARKYGVRSAMPISKAWQLCPQAIYVYPRGKRYAQVSRQIMLVLDHYSPDLEQISVDEAFLDITSTHKLFDSVPAMAHSIKKEIGAVTGLSASIGIAPNKFLAKIASDLKKPDGLVIVRKEEVVSFLQPLEISRLWGVGEKTLPLLQNMGIHLIGDLARFSQQELVNRFGKSGLHFWRLANGLDDREVQDEVCAKSVSRETTFDKDEADEQALQHTLFYLCDDLTWEMRKKKVKGRTITLKIRLSDFSTFTRSRTLAETTDKTSLIRQTVQELYAGFDRRNRAVRLLGVAMAHLNEEEEQLHLFKDERYETDRVDQVMDQVRKRFGAQAITRASLLDRSHDSNWIRE